MQVVFESCYRNPFETDDRHVTQRNRKCLSSADHHRSVVLNNKREGRGAYINMARARIVR